MITGKIAQSDSTHAAGREADVDASLVSRVQEGDTAAFNILVSRHRDRLFSIIYNLTSNRDDASDLIQDTFIKAFPTW